MADLSISGAGAAAQANATDRIPVSQSGVAKYITPLQIKSYLNIAAVGYSGAYADLTGKPSVPLLISANTHITVGSSGDFANLLDAWASLNDKVIAQNVDYTFDIAAETINHTTPLLLQGPFAGRCIIKGAAPIAANVTSIQSVSGSSGNYSAVLNVATVAGISAGHYALIEAASGGTNPEYLEGCWAITAVDAGNTRLTVALKSRVAPSGAVAATCNVLRSVLKWTGCDGIQPWGGGSAINLTDIVIAGDGVSVKQGISLQDVGRVYTYGKVGIAGWGGYGIYANYNSELNTSGTVAVSSCVSTGVYGEIGASFDFLRLIVSGNGNHGVQMDSGAVCRAYTLIGCGNTNSGATVTNKGIIVPENSGVCSGNGGYGYQITNGHIDFADATGANNAANLFSQVYLYAPSATEWRVKIGAVDTMVAWVNAGKGNFQVNGTSFSVHNASPDTTYSALYMNNDGKAKVAFRSGASSPALKWDIGHDGSSNSYRFSIYNATTSNNALTILGSNSYVGVNNLNAPTVPLHVNGAIRTAGTTVSSLPSASSAGAGSRHFVTDSTVAASGNFGAAVTGGGSNAVPVYSDGSNWRIG